MSTNEALIRERYSSGKEDMRATFSRASGLEFHYTKKLVGPYINQNSRVMEIGCATGYYGLHFANRCREYVGVDLSPENIAIFNEKIQAAKLGNVSAMIGDATKLSEHKDKCFDVVLCLGPMYHLPPVERALVFKECKRIARDGAVIAFAYISPLGSYLKAALS